MSHPQPRGLDRRCVEKLARFRDVVGVEFSLFSAGSGQMELLDPGRREKLERLARTTDGLRDRFGFSKVQLGGSLKIRGDGDEHR